MFVFKKGDFVRGYKILEKLDSGKSVFLVSKSSSNERFVMKALDGGIMNDEIKIGFNLGSKCPYLVQIFDVFRGEGGDEHVYIIMEYCEEGDLSKRIQKNAPPSSEEIYCFFYEGSKAIQTLHEAGVIHRDIKSSNFFLNKNGGYKLGDYGVARFLDAAVTKTMTHVGTDGYISPEIMEGEKAYTNKTDIYSFGITLLEYALGKHPYSNDNGTLNIVRAAMCNPIQAALTLQHPCAKVALRMISKDPSARPSAAELLVEPLPLLEPYHALAVEVFLLKQQSHANVKASPDTLFAENAVLKQRLAQLESTKAAELLAANSEVQRLRAENETLRQRQNAFVMVPVPSGMGFLANDEARWVTNSGTLLKWNTTQKAVFFVSENLNSGIHQVTFEFNQNSNATIELGLALSGLRTTLAKDIYIEKPVKGSCCMDSGNIYCGNTQCVAESFFAYTGKNVLGMLMDANQRKLYFYVDNNNKLIPHCVVNVPPSVHFVVMGQHKSLTIEIKSLLELQALPIFTVKRFQEHKWRY